MSRAWNAAIALECTLLGYRCVHTLRVGCVCCMGQQQQQQHVALSVQLEKGDACAALCCSLQEPALRLCVFASSAY